MHAWLDKDLSKCVYKPIIANELTVTSLQSCNIWPLYGVLKSNMEGRWGFVFTYVDDTSVNASQHLL